MPLHWLGVFKYLIQSHCTDWWQDGRTDRHTDTRTQPFIVKDRCKSVEYWIVDWKLRISFRDCFYLLNWSGWETRRPVENLRNVVIVRLWENKLEYYCFTDHLNHLPLWPIQKWNAMITWPVFCKLLFEHHFLKYEVVTFLGKFTKNKIYTYFILRLNPSCSINSD